MPVHESPQVPEPTTADVQEQDIDALFAGEVVADGPGAAVGIHHRGSLVLAKGYGLADLESGLPITAQTPFHVASVSKQFTAFVIAVLAREGKVDLDADVRDYLPYVPDFGSTVTVRHLVLHTSGLRDQWPLMVFGGQSMEGRITQQQIVNLVARQRDLNFTPGTDYSYSNTGYSLLAEVVFRVTGQTLREFTTEHVFAPLGMEHTFFFDDVTQVVPQRANSYTKRAEGRDGSDGEESCGWTRALLNYDNVGATSLFTTVRDLAAWAGNFTDPVVGDPALIEQVCTNGTLDDGTAINYGFGLLRDELDGRTVLRHTGADAAFRSVFVRFPEHDLAVTILANTELDLMARVRRIADLYLPAVAASAETAPAEVAEIDLPGLEGTYLPEHGTSCRLEARGGKLFYHWGSRDPQQLVARSDGTLDLDPGSRTGQSFAPVLDPARQVVGLDAPRVGYGPPLRLRRVEGTERPTAELADFIGDYRSPELDITYSITVDADELVLGHLWSSHPLRFTPVIADRFEHTERLALVLVFQRDPEQRVDHLLLHGRSDRNIRFDRVGPPQPPVPPSSTRAKGIYM